MGASEWWFLDLVVVIAVTGVSTAALFAGLSGPARIVFGAPLVLFLPGYALVSILFPDDRSGEYRPFDEEKTGLRNPLVMTDGLEPTERFVLSVTASVIVVPAVTLLTTVTPWGVTFEPILAGLSLFTVFLVLVAAVARSRCEPATRYSPSLISVRPLFTRSRWDKYGPRPQPYNIAILIALSLLIVTLAFAVANPPDTEGVTEFYVETDPVTGDIETMYESTYTAGESQELTATIANREHEDRTYTVVALLERVSYGDETVTVESRTELSSESVTVADGEQYDHSIEVTPTERGADFRVTLLLYDDDPPASPTAANADRALHLPIVVE